MCTSRKCPLCGNDNPRRVKRKKYMRLIPYSKLYECHDCYANYLVIAEKVTIITDKGCSKLFMSFKKTEKFPELRQISEIKV